MRDTSFLNCNTVSLVIDPLTSEGGLKSKKVRKQTPPKVEKTRLNYSKGVLYKKIKTLGALLQKI